MTNAVVQTRRFARAYNKLQVSIAGNVDAAVATVATDPAIGERNKGDLAALRVHEFRALGQLY